MSHQSGHQARIPPPLSRRDIAGPGSDLERPVIDQGALNMADQSAYARSMSARTVSHAATSHHDDGEDDQRSRVSVYSYRSDIDSNRFLREMGGRMFNAINETYFLPSDEDEWARLNKQHMAAVIAMGGLCPDMKLVDTILAPQPGKRIKVLDLGCGTGVWALDMAKRYPHVDVLGVDLAPVPINLDETPSNCEFEVDDIQHGLDHFQEKFDVVHARLIAGGLKDFRKSMEEINKTVKPGGLMIWVEADYDYYSRDIHEYRVIATQDNMTGTWLGRFIYELKRAAYKVGRSDIDAMAETIDAGLWDNPLFDPETCKAGSAYFPLGPWARDKDFEKSQQLQYVGALFRQDLLEGIKGARVVLEKAGWPAEEVSDWIKKASDELNSMERPIQGRFRLAWGRRRAAPGQPAPPLPLSAVPDPEDAEDKEKSSLTPYPLYFVYDTKEQSLAEAALRNRNKDFIPPRAPS